MCVRTFDRGGHDEQSITMPVTRPKRRAGRDPDGLRRACTPLVLRSLIRPDVETAELCCCSELLSILKATEHAWSLLVVIDTVDKANKAQRSRASAAELGDRRKENEKEREVEAYLQWKRKDRGQGARRLPRKPRRSVSCSFL